MGCRCRCAPLRVPFERRLQTLAIAVSFPPLALLYCVIGWALLLIFANIYVRGLVVVYTAWCFLDRTPATGGWNTPRLTKLVKGNWLHRYAFKFFGPSSSIVKTCELDPSKRYLFGYHPHGIIAVGAALAFATDGANFSSLFPGINVSLMVLKPLFKVPFYREWLMMHNIKSAGRKTCLKCLQGPPGSSICLAIGGAKEGMDANPHKMRLTLKNRKGFVKVAIETGASLVPVIGFGENELFNQVTGGCVGRAQKTFQKKAGFFVPIFWGRGVFNYSFGLLPHRNPINIVIGAPIPCPHLTDMDAQETRDAVNRIHAQYMQALEDLYNKHKDKYLPADAEGIVFK